jgi:FkbM family methyltransferase
MKTDARLPSPHGTMIKRNIYDDASKLYLKYDNRTPPIIVDGGSCRGEMISTFNTLLRKSVIHGFEAHPKLFSNLVQKFSANKNVILHNNVLSDTVGVSKFGITGYIGSASILEPTDWLIRMIGNKAKVTEVVNIPSVTLDSILEHVDIMKLDVQGAELKVLHGSIRLLKIMKVVILEVLFVDYYKNQPFFSDLYDFMIKHNFQMFGLYNLSTCTDGNLVAADALFINLDYYNKI